MHPQGHPLCSKKKFVSATEFRCHSARTLFVRIPRREFLWNELAGPQKSSSSAFSKTISVEAKEPVSLNCTKSVCSVETSTDRLFARKGTRSSADA